MMSPPLLSTLSNQRMPCIHKTKNTRCAVKASSAKRVTASGWCSEGKPEGSGYHCNSANHNNDCQPAQRPLRYEISILTLSQAEPMKACNKDYNWSSALTCFLQMYSSAYPSPNGFPPAVRGLMAKL